MKRIGLLISTMNSGGAERVVSHLSHILSEKYDVRVILFEDTHMEYECGGTLHNLNVPAKGNSPLVKLGLLRRRVAALKRLIREEKLACVVSFLDSPNFVNLLARVKGCRKVISIRNYSGLENRQNLILRLTDFAMKRLYRKADCVVTVSKLIEQDFRAHYNVPAERITTIYNPYNFDDIKEKGNVPLTDAEKAFFDGHFVFANVGRIMYQKGAWHLVKAFSKVHEKHPEARLVIVGEDKSNSNLEALIGALGLTDSVLLTGRTRNPYQYMKNAECYVLSSLFEGFPNAMVEAMACGCPTVATDCKSGPREILFEEPDLAREITEVTRADYGILVPDLETEVCWEPSVFTEGEGKLADAMLSVMENNEERARLSAEAEKRSHAFDFDACRTAYSDVIEAR